VYYRRAIAEWRSHAAERVGFPNRGSPWPEPAANGCHLARGPTLLLGVHPASSYHLRLRRQWTLTQETTLLLSSRFYAYTRGGKPWGLPNHLWSESPHVMLLFDSLVCDENALRAEELGKDRLGWVMSGLFLKLKAEGILQVRDTEDVVRGWVSRSRRRTMRSRCSGKWAIPCSIGLAGWRQLRQPLLHRPHQGAGLVRERL
jgi:hypothetical protein